MHQDTVLPLTRYRLTALKRVETEIEAENLEQAHAIANYTSIRDGVIKLRLEPADAPREEKPAVAGG